jgi:hypothetical protein
MKPGSGWDAVLAVVPGIPFVKNRYIKRAAIEKKLLKPSRLFL